MPGAGKDLHQSKERPSWGQITGVCSVLSFPQRGFLFVLPGCLWSHSPARYELGTLGVHPS